MSDLIAAETEKLGKKLVADSKEQLGKIKKIKQMVKLAAELGEDTKVIDNFIDVAESTLKDIVGKLIIKK